MQATTLEDSLQEASPTPRECGELRRSLLFVPGCDAHKLEGAASTGADTLIFDLEDSVESGSKDRARTLVAERLAAGKGESELVVRVNGCNTACFESDVIEVVAAGARSLMLPKSSTATLAHARSYLAVVEQRLSLECGCLRILGLVETANGIAGLSRLLGEPARIDALCFGNVDFSLDMGLADGDLSTGVVHHARCSLSIAAAAAGVSAIDGVCVDVRADQAFEDEARVALSLGFAGKLCIHPAQVAIANDVFTPSPAQIARAKRVVDAAAAAERSEKGVFALDGTMVDAPVLELHRRLLERARRAGVLEADASESNDGQRSPMQMEAPK